MNLDQSAPDTVQKTFCHGAINKEHHKNKWHAWGTTVFFIYTWSHRMFAECFTLSCLNYWSTSVTLENLLIWNILEIETWNMQQLYTNNSQWHVQKAGWLAKTVSLELFGRRFARVLARWASKQNPWWWDENKWKQVMGYAVHLHIDFENHV